MKKRKNSKRVYGALLISIILLASPFIIWQVKPSKSLKVLILDKTVPDTTYREHKGFMWILNNLKIKSKDTNAAFVNNNDYYGFYPLPNETYTTKELPENPGKPNLIYMTDTYGVYKEDFYKNIVPGNRSDLMYGGTTRKEVESIKSALIKNTIIGEFNTIASPTDSYARTGLETIFGLKWSGWIGRYFSDLSKENIEIPPWMKENYALQYGELWNLKGQGIVLVNSNDTIIVLRKDVELGKGLNKIEFNESAQKEFQVKNNLNYYYWFEIAQADQTTEVIANYKLDLTKEGRKLADKFGLPVEFPAIVRTKGDYTSYYFAGDFADSNSTPKVYGVSGLYFLNKITTLEEDTNRTYFYWNVYYPLIQNIVKHIN